MDRYNDLVELARICLEQARAASAPDVAAELREMAQEYQRRAAKLDAASLADTGKSLAVARNARLLD